MKIIKKITPIVLSLSIILVLCSCSINTNTQEGAITLDTQTNSIESNVEGETYQTQGQVITIVETDDSAFSNSDTKNVSDESYDALITLNGSTGTISDTTRGSSGEIVTINSKGIYLVQGTSENVTIKIDDESKSGNIYLILDNVSMTNSSFACIYVKNADKVVLQCNGNNYITYTSTTVPTDDTSKIDGAIHSKNDLTINGTGTLTIKSSLHGIVCKKDFKITDGTIVINATNKGIDVNKSVSIGGGNIEITAGHDGIQVNKDDGTSYFYMEDGVLKITSGYDGICVNTDTDVTFTGYLKIAGGTINITAGGGSSKSSSSSTSKKGIKCDGDIYIGDANITVSSADDSIHSNMSISITSGTLTLSSSDDGIHADSTLSISGGNVNVNKSYEGLEAYVVNISGGTINVYASDDGINAAGGSDTTSSQTNPWARFSASTGTLYISGGTLYINASGDGLDSNGSIYISGGTTIVEGPTNSGNGALDKGDGNNCVCQITGGTVLALGSTGMAINFDSGSQCSALVTISGGNGTKITVNDGSGFTFTASKTFACAVYSSPYMKKGSTYTLTAGSNSTSLNFSSSLYYSTVQSFGPGGGGFRKF